MYSIPIHSNSSTSTTGDLPIDAVQRGVFVLLSLLACFMLQSYAVDYSQDYFYMAFRYAALDTPRQVLVYAMVLLMGFLMPLRMRSAAPIVLHLLYWFAFIPAAALICVDVSYGWWPFVSLTVVYASLCIWGNRSNSAAPSDKTIAWPQPLVFYGALVVLFLAFVAILIQTYGISMNIVGFGSVYETRAVFKGDSSRWSIYSYNWLAKVINVLVLIFALRRKNILLAGISVITTLYLYAIGGHKSVLLLSALVVFAYTIFSLSPKYFPIVLGFAICSLLSLCQFYDWLMQSDYTMLSLVLVQRNFLIPAQLYYFYVDFGQTMGYNWFADNLPFSLLYDSRFDMEIPSAVAKKYLSGLSNKDTYANANVFADFATNLGNWALVIGIPVGIVVLSLLNWFMRNAGLMAYCLMVVLAFNLVNSGLIVTMITHGGLLSILIIYCLKHIERPLFTS